MSIDPQLQKLLETLADEDMVEVLFLIDADAVQSPETHNGSTDILASRKRFAEQAEKVLYEVIDHASLHSGSECAEKQLFRHMASARITASVAVIRHLAEHPAVATIGLAQAQ